MDSKPWRSAVQIQTEPGELKLIASTKDAIGTMSEDWPVKGPKYRHLQIICLDVLAGNRSTKEAKDAFLEACEEAHIPISA